jgi:hypothetical protein
VRVSALSLLVLVSFFTSGKVFGSDQTCATLWSSESYSDESGFQVRMQPVISELANQDYAKRQMAFSKCPDTGKPVYTWAVKVDLNYADLSSFEIYE